MPAPDHDGLQHLLRLVQDGVVSRPQLRDLDFAPHDVERMLRRRDLTVVHRGVFVTHTGELTWEQRSWAAVLATDGALTRESGMPRPPRRAAIQVAIDARRTVRRLDGVRVHRTAHLAERLHPLSAPPRVRIEHAVVDLADDATDAGDALHLLADALHTRTTDVDALRSAVGARKRLGRRRLLLDLLDDLATGATSALERAYLRDVERAHRLPEGARQARDVGRGHDRAARRRLRTARPGGRARRQGLPRLLDRTRT